MTQQRCGLIAIVGAPNAGKSTLVNALVGSEVEIAGPVAARPGAVFDHDGLAQDGLDRLGQDARAGVGRGGGQVGHQPLDGPVGIGCLRPGGGGSQRQGGGGQ